MRQTGIGFAAGYCFHDFGLLCKLLLCVYCRAFHHYREQRGQKEPLKKNPELDRLLREEYRCLEDFRAKEKNGS